jgi:hypothetical protein
MALSNRIGNLSACVVRNSVLRKIDEKFFDMGFADWFLGLALGQFGLLAKQKSISSVYRIHSNGLWSGDTSDLDIRMINTIDEYNKRFLFKYDKEFCKLRLQHNISFRRKKILLAKTKLFIPPIIIWILKALLPPIVVSLLNFIKKKFK